MRRRILVALFAPLAAVRAQSPVGDFHQHLFSPTAVAMLNQPRGINATDLIALLDSGGDPEGRVTLRCLHVRRAHSCGRG